MILETAYPKSKTSLSGLSIKISGIKSSTSDPGMAMEMVEIGGEEAYWNHGSWYLPARPEVADRLISRLKVTLPAEVERRVSWLAKVNEARAKANRWRRTLSIEDQRQWLIDRGHRYKVFPPLNHQTTSIGFGLQVPVFGLLLDTGLGKTYVVSSILQMLKDSRGKGQYLVVAPKSLIRSAWGKDLKKHNWLTWSDIGDPDAPEPMSKCPKCGRDFGDKPVPKGHLKTHMRKRLAQIQDEVKASFQASGDEVADFERFKAEVSLSQSPIWEAIYDKWPALRPAGSFGHSERVEAELKRTDIDVYIINPERAKMVKDHLMAKKFAFMAVDESSMMRAHDSDTTQALLDIAWTSPRRCMMSGTPRPNSNLELWGQMAALDGSLGHTFSKYRSMYFYPDHMGYNWYTKPGMDAKISSILEDRTLRYKLKDCVDLPPETEEVRSVDIGPELRSHYKSMLEDMIVELEDDDVSTANKLTQVNKLAQITSGFIYDKDKNVHYLSESNPKLKETVSVARRLVEEEGRAVTIWVRFSKQEAKAFRDLLGDLGVSVMIGGMSSKNLEQSADDYLSGKNKIMVAHPLTAKFGHTWTHSTVCIFHSYDYSWENYYQGKHRIYRIGQKQPVTYITIVGKNTVDGVIMKAMKRKERESAVVIDRNFVNSLRETL